MELDRFVHAQTGVYESALAELRSGEKRGHWIWFIFPQIAGLGHSATAEYYAIGTLDEARAYIGHPLLGSRLRECTQAVIDVEGRTLTQIFGWPDNLKFRSSMTLFAHATDDNAVFREALKKYCGGEFDEQTLKRI